MLTKSRSNSGSGKFLLYTALATGATAAAVESASAQSAITIESVSTQSTAATTAITAVGAVLVTMAFGLLVFSVVTGVIRKVMGG